MDLHVILAEELKLNKSQVSKTVALFDDGHTIPFIARYRKEVTGNLNEDVLRELEERIKYLRNLEDRKEQIIKSIEEQGKMTPDLRSSIVNSWKLQQIEDLYLPFRQKRKTKASVAKEKGLTPVADLIMELLAKEKIDGEALKFLAPDKELNTVEDVIKGAKDILAERISENLKMRELLRAAIHKTGKISSQAVDKEKRSNYEIYYDFSEKYSSLPPHRILAINRGEREKYLTVSIEIDEENTQNRMGRILGCSDEAEHDYFRQALRDSFKRLLFPSIEREMRKIKTQEGEKKAIEIFSHNLRNLLLQPPIRGYRVIGIDPGFRTGCKLASVDENGGLLGTATIYPHPPQNQKKEACKVVKEMLQTGDIKLISLGNGTACRETEAFLAEFMDEFPPGVVFAIVSEAGASVYSASPLAKEEFPDMDVSMRGAVSIARRLLDPLPELVKIEAKAIGVGMYQHDVDQKELARISGDTVSSVVNLVGVNLNNASVSLLEYVSGINSKLARNIYAYRQKNGIFRDRKELLNVTGLGEKTFVQCSGFLRIQDGANPLDNTPIHPESYGVVEGLFLRSGFNISDLRVKSRWNDMKNSLGKFSIPSLAAELNVGEPTLRDILEALQRPGRDPREDIPLPVFRKDVLTIEQLRPGMALRGTVRNVVDFGAFVDIGVKRDGLIHISSMGPLYVKNPLEILSVGQVLDVNVLSVDIDRNRISLSLT